MAFNLDTVFGIHESALYLREQRAGLIASNLANADTPGYQARDMDFRRALELADNPGSEGLRRTHGGHMAGADNLLRGGEPMYRLPTQPSIDGNTVDTQVEQANYMRNSIQYMSTLRFMSGSVRGLMTAIKGE